MKSNRGFTIVEILITISIMGAIASIIIGAITRVKDKADDAAIKTNLVAIKSQAELYYDDNSRSYSAGAVSTCNAAGSLFIDNTIALAISSSEEKSGDTASCYANSSSWAVSVPLKTDPSIHWCVDSIGGVGGLPAAVATTTCGL